MMRHPILFLLALLLAPACGSPSRDVPAGPPPACSEMPAECPAQQACTVSVSDDGKRICGGEACCASFCEVNACDVCCGPPVR